MTRQSHRAVEYIFRKHQFSQKFTNLSQNFRDNNQNNQSEMFPVLQEELEWQKSQKVNKNTLKLSTKTSLNIFNEW